MVETSPRQNSLCAAIRRGAICYGAWGVRRLALLSCCFLLLPACTNTRTSPAPVGEMGISSSGGLEQHTVSSGDTLYSIAWRYGVDFKEVASWNQISAPYQIYAGQSLLIARPDGYRQPVAKNPVEMAQAEPAPVAVPPPPTKHKPKPKVKAKESVAKVAKPAPPPPPPPQSAGEQTPSGRGPVKWSWPVNGTILSTFSTRVTGRKGVDIGGKRGLPIKAAATGKVVYSGSGLVGYGKLIIVKHNDKYLSAYGHNDALLVQEGQFVNVGQTIAKMGLSDQRAQLHFEIRRDGKPVDPLTYLSKR